VKIIPTFTSRRGQGDFRGYPADNDIFMIGYPKSMRHEFYTENRIILVNLKVKYRYLQPEIAI
jgi:hypothetical protein